MFRNPSRPLAGPLAIGTFPGNHAACRFYEARGAGVVGDRFDFERKDIHDREIVYLLD